MDSQRAVTEGQLRRLTEELIDERLGVIESSVSPAAVVDELDYALRPPCRRVPVPSYGSFVLPTRDIAEWNEPTGLEFFVSEASERADDDVRRYADGVSSWTIRTLDGVTALVVFDRPAGSERDLVVLAEATGATIVQRHPIGLVRLVGSSFGVVRWDGVGWHREPPIGAWLKLVACGLDRRAPRRSTGSCASRCTTSELAGSEQRSCTGRPTRSRQRSSDGSRPRRRCASTARPISARSVMSSARSTAQRCSTRRAHCANSACCSCRARRRRSSRRVPRYAAHVGAPVQLRRSDCDRDRCERARTCHRAASWADHRPIPGRPRARAGGRRADTGRARRPWRRRRRIVTTVTTHV